MVSENITPGEFGPYRLIRVLGSGGMGIVHEAWDTRLDRRVALKMLHPHLLLDADLASRFKDEAKRAARIEHPNVVRVYRVDSCDDRVAIEMQYIDGTPLNVILRDGPIPAPDAVGFLRQVLEALSACHRQGVIHCDLKPANLLVKRDGTAILTDFGIARALHDDAAEAEIKTLTTGPLTSLMWGTPQYSPPEVWEGAPLGPQSDLYAAGVLTYESITGISPFQAPNPIAIMKAICTREIPTLHTLDPSISTELSDLVSALMARDVARRPKDADTVLAALASVPESSMQPMDTQRLERIFETQIPSVAKARTNKPRNKVRSRLVWAALVVLAFCSVGAFTAFNSNRGTLVTTDPLAEGLLVVGNTAYFVANDGVVGKELWYSNEKTGTCRLLADIAPGSASSNPRSLLVCESGGFVFTADSNDEGSELWHCSRTGADSISVRLLYDLSPGPSSSDPLALASFGSNVVILAKTQGTGNEYWLCDTKTGETSLIKDVFPGPDSSTDKPSTCIRPEGMYFHAREDNVKDHALFFYEFSSRTVKRLCNLSRDTEGMAKGLGAIYFRYGSEATGNELACYDENTGEFRFTDDIWEGPESSSPKELISIGSRVFFKAETPEHGIELYATNGVTKDVSGYDLNLGPDDSDPQGFVTSGLYLFFAAKDNTYGNEPWAMKLIGPEALMMADINKGPESSNPYNLLAGDSFLLFSARDGDLGEELFAGRLVDGKWKVHIVEDIYPGTLGSEPTDSQWTQDNRVFFLATTPQAGRTLCVLTVGADINGLDLPDAQKSKVDVLRLYR
ncbi:MAG: protein kinase [Candidatus Hydrogenedentes bacterium]|nr:protein kinase [Candidatus Hydrogenedentota bacterium]